ncbi:unnamed protein product [Rotaria sordida]|uniref:YCII-related domain-containing protein n=1 Tax=Rotaria sordida TaxID=392033 RepID=A0A813WQJ6_9BILA|nr:unnamed protein product [Rotaria sordida]
MPKSKRKVLVLHYFFNNDDFLKKRNEIRPAHLSYLRQHSNHNGNKVEFKVAESLDGKSFYWPLTTHHNEIMRFMQEDPYYTEGLVRDVTIYMHTIIEKCSS